MRKRAPTVKKLFADALRQRLPMFVEDRSLRIDGGGAGFVFPFHSSLHFAVWLVRGFQGMAINVELSWSRGPVGPGGTAPPGISPSLLPADRGLPVNDLVPGETRTSGWFIGDPMYAGPVRIVADAESAIADALERVVAWGLPFFRSIVAREAPECLEKWDAAFESTQQ